MCDGCPVPSSVKSNAGIIHDLALMLQPLHNLLLAQPVRQIEQNKKGREFWTIL